jgi:hypothetical protein
MTEHSIKNAKKLIFVRHLGHKRDLKGVGQWRLSSAEENNCWVCDHQIYTLIFWTESYARKEMEGIP